jgi:hypothetical protein
MSQPHPKKRWKNFTLWEIWTLVTILAELIGIFLIAGLSLNLSFVGNSLVGSAPANLVLIAMGVAFGVFLGFAQWLIIRRYLHHSVRWIVVTALGTTISWGVGIPIVLLLLFIYGSELGNIDISALLKGILLLGAGIGLVVGYLQWLVLKNRTRDRSGAWILANVIAWGLGLVAAFFSRFVVLAENSWMAMVVPPTILGAIVGAITGSMLVWLLRPHSIKRGSIKRDSIKRDSIKRDNIKHNSIKHHSQR